MELLNQIAIQFAEAATETVPTVASGITDLGMAYIALAIMCVAIGIVGLGEGIAVAKGFEGIGRNPSCAGTMRTSMIIGVALIETCGIYSFVIALIFLFTKVIGG